MRKAQGAMEFMMTYGWAMLILLIAIGALVYFGVLDPSRFQPGTCLVEAGIGCKDFIVNADGSAKVMLTNGMGTSVTGASVSLGGIDAEASCSNVGWAEGVNKECTWGAGTFTVDAGDRFKEDIKVVYKKSASGFQHLKKGELITEVE